MEGAEIAVIGASGDIGRAIVTEVLHERVLTPAGRMQLVGRADGPGMGRLLGLVSDLTDAYAEVAPGLEVRSGSTAGSGSSFPTPNREKGMLRRSRVADPMAMLTRMRKIHVLSEERDSKRSMLRSTRSHVS